MTIRFDTVVYRFNGKKDRQSHFRAVAGCRRHDPRDKGKQKRIAEDNGTLDGWSLQTP